MWQVKLVFKNPKINANIFLGYLYLNLSSSDNKRRNMVIKINSFVTQGTTPCETLFFKGTTRTEVMENIYQDIACNCEAVLPRTSEPLSEGSQGTNNKPRKNTSRQDQSDVKWQLINKRGDLIEYRNVTFKPVCVESVIKFSGNFRASSKNAVHIDIKRKPSISEQSPRSFNRNPKVLDYSPCKNKHTYGRNYTHARHQDIYGRRVCLDEQPQVCPRWQAQDKIFKPSERQFDRGWQVHNCMAPEGP